MQGLLPWADLLVGQVVVKQKDDCNIKAMISDKRQDMENHKRCF
jgi:hypothetical protein